MGKAHTQFGDYAPAIGPLERACTLALELAETGVRGSSVSAAVGDLNRAYNALAVAYWHTGRVHSWYEAGYVDEEFYAVNFRDVVREMAPRWEAIGIWPIRPAYRKEVERIVTEETK